MRITLEIRDGLDPEVCLKKLATWYQQNRLNPQRHPMTGILAYYDGTVMIKREYTKSECFLIHQELATRPDQQGEK